MKRGEGEKERRETAIQTEEMALQPDWHRKVGELTEKQKLQFLFIPEADFGSLSIKFSEGRKSHISTHSPLAPASLDLWDWTCSATLSKWTRRDGKV